MGRTRLLVPRHAPQVKRNLLLKPDQRSLQTNHSLLPRPNDIQRQPQTQGKSPAKLNAIQQWPLQEKRSLLPEPDTAQQHPPRAGRDWSPRPRYIDKRDDEQYHDRWDAKARRHWSPRPRYIDKRDDEQYHDRWDTRAGREQSSKSRVANKDDDEQYLDRWDPKMDRDHYQRVRLYRKRKAAINRNRLQQRRPNGDFLRSHQNYLENVREWTEVSSSPDASSPSSSSETDVPEPGPSACDLRSALQDELAEYDEQIKSLRENEWPALPEPRAAALRFEGSEFSRRRAQEIKRWSLVEGFLYGGHSVALRTTDRVRAARCYGVGVIFSAPYHTASSSDERWVAADDPHNTATPFGTVHSKFRKLVVVRAFGEHCVCLPLYSHNGRGLAGRAFVDEYVSIRDVDDPRREPPEGVHGCLLALAFRGPRGGGGGRVVAGRTSVKLTEFYCHRYDAPASIEGVLDRKSDSASRLLDLVRFVGDY